MYDSAYVAAVTALAGALWLFAGGFYVVRVAIARDGATGVGELLAVTPLRTTEYLFGKFLSNLLVLGSMAGVLVGTALVMQVARGESTGVDPVALLAPFVLFTLPVLAAASGCAVLFETVPLLRGGLGNVVWFFLSMTVMIAGQSPSAPLGGLGMNLFAESVKADMAARHIAVRELSLGLMYLDRPPRTFVWSGLDLTWGFAAERLALAVLAGLLAVVPALWFARFDPARRAGRPAPVPVPDAVPIAVPGPVPQAVVPGHDGASGREGTLDHDEAVAGGGGFEVRAVTAPRPGGAAGRLLAGELRILVRGVSRWWWAGVAALTVVGLLAPTEIATGPLLLATSVWPALIWSRLGTQGHENGVGALLGAYPGVRRRVLAEWAAGVVLTAFTGLVPVLRMALAADGPGTAAWAAGTLFIPSLALALGVLGRTHRLFQALYLPLWYMVVNAVAALDYIGAVRAGGRPAGPDPLAVAGVAAVLLATALAVVTFRHARR
ncbi:ABC transporter permease [Sphaerisporangium corydalis]|uniref:ABC transporter permease n=1 Tax=Sphaerisporangium corydalis TaxID=1441875 RepID=A0ABV9EJY0_9ACTN|nr:ABC transporter permease [Sphaerisporangium corydalis]